MDEGRKYSPVFSALLSEEEVACTRDNAREEKRM